MSEIFRIFMDSGIAKKFQINFVMNLKEYEKINATWKM